jgi:Flp pilus assembly pilin Flp
MRSHFKRFLIDQSGAVSTDWVVLTAAITIMAGAIALTVKNHTVDAGQDLQVYVQSHITE